MNRIEIVNELNAIRNTLHFVELNQLYDPAHELNLYQMQIKKILLCIEAIVERLPGDVQ